MRIVELEVFGKGCVVKDAKGKEITRREGFLYPSRFFVRFPHEEYSINAKVLDEKEVFPKGSIELPIPEKRVKDFGIKKRVYIKDWHSPASINVGTGEFRFNREFVDASKAKQKFIEEHENGHFFYDTEKKCDLYAAKKMLESGYGKSQCLEVLRNMLTNSSEKDERYNYVNSYLEKL